MAPHPRAANSRKALIVNLRLLHKLNPMLPQIAQIIFEENGLDKPTQNLFNNITYYLLFLIDPQFHSSLTWPLFDTKAERAYRSELSGFISRCAAKRQLTNLPASFLVHPSCYKVSVLMHQLSVLAMRQMLIQRIKGTEKQKLFDDVTAKFKKRNDNRCFLEDMKGFNYNYEQNICAKLSIFLEKKQRNERIAEMLRTKIIEGERKVSTAEGYIDRLINGFVEKNELDELFKSEVLKIKNINEPAPIFNMLLEEVDREVDSMVEKWDAKVLPLLEKCRHMQQMSEELVKREMGQIERSSYMLEYDPQRDFINTEELQSGVNSAQKYVLRNIQQNGRLNFPNLIHAYVISMSYILKDHQFGNEIYDYNNRLKAYQKGLSDVKLGFIALLQRVDRAEKKLKLGTVITKTNIQQKSIDHLQIPPLVDLSGIKMCQNDHDINFEGFTPINFSKHKFNLLRRGEVSTQPLPKSVLTAYHAPKDDFLKKLLSCRVRETTSHDHGDKIQNGNLSVIPNIKANETTSECPSGFSKQQIWRMLSTKKSSLRKPKKVHEHINVKAKKGGLLDESLVSKDSQGLFRSYSSPNVLENRNKGSTSSIRGRKLSITAEDHPQLNVSGIACLDNNFSTSPGLEVSKNTDNFSKIRDTPKNEPDKVLKQNLVSVVLDQESHPSKLTASKIPKIIIQDEQETHFSKTEETGNKLTASKIPRIIVQDEQETHFSKTEETGNKLTASKIPMIIVQDEQETHFSKTEETGNKLSASKIPMIIVQDEQETHFSKTEETGNKLTASKIPMIIVQDEQETHFSKTEETGNKLTASKIPMIIVQDEQETHFWKTEETGNKLTASKIPMIIVQDEQETHFSKTEETGNKLTASKIPMIIVQDEQETHFSKTEETGNKLTASKIPMIIVQDEQETHFSKTEETGNKLTASKIPMIIVQDEQETHFSKTEETGNKLTASKIPMIIVQDEQEIHFSKTEETGNKLTASKIPMIIVQDEQETHFSKTEETGNKLTASKIPMIIVQDEQETHFSKTEETGNKLTASKIPMIIVQDEQETHFSKTEETGNKLTASKIPMIIVQDEQETHFSKTEETGNKLTASKIPMIIVQDEQETHFSKTEETGNKLTASKIPMIIVQDEQETHFSKTEETGNKLTASKIPMIIVQDEQEIHFSKTEETGNKLTASKIPMIIVQDEQETHFSKTEETGNKLTASKIPMIIVQDEQETHFSKTEETGNKLTASKIPMIIVQDEQETHFSKTEETGNKLTASKIPMIIVQDEQETHFSKTEETGKLQETHLTKIVVEKELPNISISPLTEHTKKITARELQETHLSEMVTPSVSTINLQESHSTNVTPKPNTALIKKTSPVEKFINRFKQFRASALPLIEENENLNPNKRLENINRNLLPNLLSPSMESVCSDSEDEGCSRRRVSLGTLLGVDHTFLDQFDLSD